MTPAMYFSDSYESARARIVAACDSAGLLLQSFEHPAVKTPSGGPAVCDVAWVGDKNASRVLVTCSGTHGIEGFYGSGIQLGWVLEKRYLELPDDLAVLHVHAINPYGFSWLRRVNEDNIDLNRNFFDSARIPQNESYKSVHDFIVPVGWGQDEPVQIQHRVDEYVAAHGQKTFNAAVMGGQHTHADGLYYGGLTPVWSNHTLRHISDTFLSRAQHIAVIDLHAGLGPFAHAELICRHPPGSEALDRARSWYGSSVSSPAAGDSSTPTVDGNLRMAFGRWCEQASVTAIGIEVGTLPLNDVLMALYADNWLYARGDPGSALGARVKSDMLSAFYPASDDWRGLVYARAIEIMQQALEGLRQAR